MKANVGSSSLSWSILNDGYRDTRLKKNIIYQDLCVWKECRCSLMSIRFFFRNRFHFHFTLVKFIENKFKFQNRQQSIWFIETCIHLHNKPKLCSGCEEFEFQTLCHVLNNREKTNSFIKYMLVINFNGA